MERSCLQPRASCSGRQLAPACPARGGRPSPCIAPWTSGTSSTHRRDVRRRAGPEDGQQQDSIDDLKTKFFTSKDLQGPGGAQPRQPSDLPAGAPRPGKAGDGDLSIDDVNPYVLGRRTRQAFDTLWSQIARISTPTKSFVIDDVMEPSMDLDYAPQAASTTVLVVGATGRVGRIVLRKLLLRGYKVKALVRGREGGRSELAIPDSVEVVTGDVGEMADCQKAVRGVNKVIFCAASRSSFTGELVRVDERGVANVVKAMQDEFQRTAAKSRGRYNERSKREIADFSRVYHQLKWDVTFCGTRDADPRRPNVNRAEAVITDDGNLLFSGTLYQRGAVAEVGAMVNPLLPGGEHRTRGTEGITMRVKGDGCTYGCVLGTKAGFRYVARFPTRPGYLTVRLPFASFRPTGKDKLEAPALDPEAITSVAVRYEVKRGLAAAAAMAAKSSAAAAASSSSGVASTAAASPAAAGSLAARAATLGSLLSLDSFDGSDDLQLGPSTSLLNVSGSMDSFDGGGDGSQKFELEIDWIKALPSGAEPDVVLVSCAGAKRPGVPDDELAKIVSYKRKGEELLRNSGLGYSIIRPGPLVEEPGGYKALVFDQGGRINQAISASDVADVCLRALHEPEARNKAFEVSYEYQSEEGLQMYELVAHVPDASNNYLKPALATLQKNT